MTKPQKQAVPGGLAAHYNCQGPRLFFLFISLFSSFCSDSFVILKWLLQPSALSTYLNMFEGKKKGSRKKSLEEAIFKKLPASLFLNFIDQNYITCPSLDFLLAKEIETALNSLDCS